MIIKCKALEPKWICKGIKQLHQRVLEQLEKSEYEPHNRYRYQICVRVLESDNYFFVLMWETDSPSAQGSALMIWEPGV